MSQITLPPVSAFVGDVVCESACVSILTMARVDVFEMSLAYGKRVPWFRIKCVCGLKQVDYLLRIDAPV